MRPVLKTAEPSWYHELAEDYEVYLPDDEDMSIEEIDLFFNEYDWYHLARELQDDPTADEIAALEKKAALIHALKDFPREARFDLITDIGAYCAYCEIPCLDFSNAHVEHVKPKKWFPQEMLKWENFLIACRDCNSRKSTKPTSDENAAQYVWPDTDARANRFRYRLIQYDRSTPGPGTNVTPVPLDPQPQLNGEINSVSFVMSCIQQADGIMVENTRWGILGRATFPMNRVRARLGNFLVGETDVAVMVWGETADSSRTINDLLALNSFSDSTCFTDRRMAERTMTWFQAVDALNNWMQLRELGDAPQPVLDALKDQIKEAMIGSGFWSIWYSLFVTESIGHLSDEDMAMFRDILVGPTFPGTDDERI